MPVTLKDIAKLANIDPGAVSRTLRNHPKAQELRPETRERILKIAKKLNYQCNLLASSTRTGHVTTIAVIGRFDQMQVSISETQILSGILKESSIYNYGVKVFEDSDLKRVFAEISGNRIQYVISLSVEDEIRAKTAEFCKQQNLHMVYIYEHAHDKFPAVTLDNITGAKQAVLYLAGLGHKRIALLCAAHHYHYVRERHEGYLEGMKQAGLPINPELIYCSENTAAAVKQMLDLPRIKRPTAVFGIADNLAAIAQYTALRSGLSLPEELSTFGFGASEIGLFSYCPLSTVHENFIEQGRIAVKLLLGQSLNILPNESGNYLVHPSLTFRESTAKPLLP